LVERRAHQRDDRVSTRLTHLQAVEEALHQDDRRLSCDTGMEQIEQDFRLRKSGRKAVPRCGFCCPGALAQPTAVCSDVLGCATLATAIVAEDSAGDGAQRPPGGLPARGGSEGRGGARRTEPCRGLQSRAPVPPPRGRGRLRRALRRCRRRQYRCSNDPLPPQQFQQALQSR
jgi:hypothetical protein